MIGGDVRSELVDGWPTVDDGEVRGMYEIEERGCRRGGCEDVEV